MIDKIRERCNLPNARAAEIAEMAGPAEIDGSCCENCGVAIRLKNRSLANQFIKNFLTESSWAEQGRSMLCEGCEARINDLSRQQKADALKVMPYSAYLKSGHWHDTREKALLRAGYKCQICSAPNGLHVHHRTYARRGDEAKDDVTVLCASCHSIFHSNGKLAENGRAA
jgi:DNA-directed RNA polymerase subunit RPC12/RpoP